MSQALIGQILSPTNLQNLKLLGLDIKSKLNLDPVLKLKNLETLVLPDSYHSKLKERLPKNIRLM